MRRRRGKGGNGLSNHTEFNIKYHEIYIYTYKNESLKYVIIISEVRHTSLTSFYFLHSYLFSGQFLYIEMVVIYW